MAHAALLTHKTISSMVLIGTIFTLIYMWFRQGIFSVWKHFGTDPSEFINGVRPQPGSSLPPDEQAHFALVAALTHTAMLCLGMCMFLATSFVVETTPVRKVLRKNWQRQSASFISTAVLSIAFYVALRTWFTYRFSLRAGIAYQWAAAFFYETGNVPFGSWASISYCLCLLSGYLIKHSTRDSKTSAFPSFFTRWFWHVMVAFVVSFWFFRYLAIPVWRQLLRPYFEESRTSQDAEFNHSFVSVATATHTLALVVGMLTNRLSSSGWLTVSNLLSGAKLSDRASRIIQYSLLVVWITMLFLFMGYCLGIAAQRIRQHHEDYPNTLLSMSHAVWFIWGYLLITNRMPSMVTTLFHLYMLPYRLCRNRPDSSVRRVWRTVTVVLLYNLEKVVVATLILSLCFGPYYPKLTIAAWCMLLLRYVPTYFNSPVHSGWRTLPDMDRHEVFDELGRYFDFSLLYDGPSLNKQHKYIFGFHPHGVIPISMGFINHTSAWDNAFPDIRPSLLTSSILHHVPLMRDLLQFSGGCDVSRRGFAVALERRGSVAFVPGGQQEMIKTSSTSKHVYVCGSHKGFVRLALKLALHCKEPLHIVPMFNFGESKILDNLPFPQKWQDWSVKTLRANVFFAPWGRWRMLGVPRPERMGLAVGEPIPVPRLADHQSNEAVDLLHRRYMSDLVELFNRYKERAGYAGHVIHIEPEVARITESDYEDAIGRFDQVACPQETSLSSIYPKPSDSLEQLWTGAFWATMFGTIFYRAITNL